MFRGYFYSVMFAMISEQVVQIYYEYLNEIILGIMQEEERRRRKNN